jgi:hypothetical protein
MHRLLLVVVACLLLVGCTVKPHVSGAYHGTSTSSGGEGAGRLIFSHPF